MTKGKSKNLNKVYTEWSLQSAKWASWMLKLYSYNLTCQTIGLISTWTTFLCAPASSCLFGGLTRTTTLMWLPAPPPPPFLPGVRPVNMKVHVRNGCICTRLKMSCNFIKMSLWHVKCWCKETSKYNYISLILWHARPPIVISKGALSSKCIGKIC